MEKLAQKERWCQVFVELALLRAAPMNQGFMLKMSRFADDAPISVL